MTDFDMRTLSRDAVIAEAARRKRNRDAGRAVTDDGPVAVDERCASTPIVSNPYAADNLVLSLPWSCLVADNRKYAPAKGRDGRPKIILSAEYRAGKKKASNEIAHQLDALGFDDPLIGRLSIRAVMYEPNRSSRRDLSNYAKLVHDVLGAAGVYVDDSQLDLVEWIRAGVDVDRPRLEITIRPALPKR